MFVQIAILSVPMAFAWIILAGQPSLQGFIVGYIFGFAILTVIRMNSVTPNDASSDVRLSRVPKQVVLIAWYIVHMAWNILLSGIDVARRILPRKMKIEPGTQCIETAKNEKVPSLVSALSAHSITITPGSLVIDFDECDEGTMYVHVLDTNTWTQEFLEAEQAQRLTQIKGMLGYD